MNGELKYWECIVVYSKTLSVKMAVNLFDALKFSKIELVGSGNYEAVSLFGLPLKNDFLFELKIWSREVVNK